MTQRLSFFADLEDLKELIETIESRQRIHYYEAGRFETNDIPCFSSLLKLPTLGLAATGISSLNRYYLILPLDISLKIREVTQRAGGIAFHVDQLFNPNSVLIRIGGLWEEQTIIPCIIDTLKLFRK